MAQSVKHLTLDFGSGHDLMVRGIEPHVRLCTDSMEAAWDCLPLSASPLRTHTHTHTLCPSPVHALSLSKINKH